MDLNYLKNKAYQIAKDHGWHDENHSCEHWTMLILTEVSEAVQADREGKYADLEQFKANFKDMASAFDNDKAFVMSFEMWIKNTLEDELADICIRTLDMAGVYGMNLSVYNPWKDANDESKKPLIERFSNSLVSEWGFLFSASLTDAVEDGISPKDFSDMIKSVIMFAKSRRINIEWFIEQKMKYNESRPYRHGGKKY